MTALTSNFNRTEKEGKLVSMPAGANHIYKNALLMLNAAGFVQPAAALAGAVYAGMAYEECDNSGGAAGDKSVRIERESALEIAGSGFVSVDLGKEVYASDDNTVSTTQGANEVAVGIIIEVIAADKVLVKQNTLVAKP